MTRPHVMLDLETLGTAHNAAILSIGAIKFDPMGDENSPDERFHVAIDPRTCTDYGMTVDASTVMWWLDDQRDEARKDMSVREKLDLPSALYGFVEWFGPKSLPIWGNAASFDNTILKTAYELIGMDPPWRFWDDRCYRTLKNLAPGVEMDRTGTHHTALDDAVSQARHMQRIVAHLGLQL